MVKLLNIEEENKGIAIYTINGELIIASSSDLSVHQEGLCLLGLKEMY